MIDALNPYPAYRDSGVPWLEQIPDHWTATAVKRHYAVQLGKMLQGRPSGPDDEQVHYLKAQHVQWFAVRVSGAPKMWASPRDIEQYRIAAGDLLVCEGGEGGRCGIVREFEGTLIIQNALHRVRALDQCQNDYLQYVMSTVAATGWFDAINNKATIAHFTKEKFGALGVPIPSPSEQDAIVRFLDHAGRRIQRYIGAKRKLIGLLNEQKQAIIHAAVTRGLHPAVRLKPSGVEWLGDIPEHWEVWQMGHFARVGNGSTPSRSSTAYWTGGSYPWLNSSSVNRGQINSADQFVTEVALQECHLPRVRPGSVLVAITGQGKTRGTAAALTIEATINQHIAYVTPRKNVVTTEYLHLALVGAYRELRAISDDSGSTKGALTCGDIAHFKVALPPLNEQARIVSSVRQQTERLEAAIAYAEREIELIQEYRTRLIADVVTGKLDVRAAAARRPVEEQEADGWDEGGGEEEVEMAEFEEIDEDEL